MEITYVIIICAVEAVLIALIASFAAIKVSKSSDEKKIGSAESRARDIIDEAIKTAEAKKKEALLEAKTLKLRTSWTRKSKNEEAKYSAMKRGFSTKKKRLIKKRTLWIKKRTTSKPKKKL